MTNNQDQTMSIRTTTQRRIAAVAVPAAAVASTAGLAGLAGLATPADAAVIDRSGDVGAMSCSHDWSNKDADYGYVDADWLMRKSGPHAGCSAYGQEPDGTKIYYHCYVSNSQGTWTHGRVAGTSKYGWFYDDYLSDGGSLEYC